MKPFFACLFLIIHIDITSFHEFKFSYISCVCICLYNPILDSLGYGRFYKFNSLTVVCSQIKSSTKVFPIKAIIKINFSIFA